MPDEQFEKGFAAGIAVADRVVADLESLWRNSAADIRSDGTWNSGWPFYRNFTTRKWEEAAKGIESAAGGLTAIRSILATRKPR